MLRFRSSWSCIGCFNDPGEVAAGPDNKLMVLNLYAGLGGNRKNWAGNIVVTAVENDAKIAAQYKRFYPEDIVVIGDAHSYLLSNYWKFDFIWSSPPCPTHSRMNFIFRDDRRKYVDMSLYQEIILLKKFYKGRFVIENVVPYYESLVPADYNIGRHLFWSNFPLTENVTVPKMNSFIDAKKQDIMGYLGIYITESLYVKGNKDNAQVLRNCLHPVIGESIFNDLKKYLSKTK